MLHFEYTITRNRTTLMPTFFWETSIPWCTDYIVLTLQTKLRGASVLAITKLWSKPLLAPPGHLDSTSPSLKYYNIVISTFVATHFWNCNINLCCHHNHQHCSSRHLVGVLKSKTVPATEAIEPVGINLSDTGVKLMLKMMMVMRMMVIILCLSMDRLIRWTGRSTKATTKTRRKKRNIWISPVRSDPHHVNKKWGKKM